MSGREGGAPAARWHSRVAEQFDAGYEEGGRFRERFEVWREVLERLGKPGGRVLDFGCGSGRLDPPLLATGCRVVGVDGSPALLNLARKRASRTAGDSVDWMCADLATLDHRDLGRFDLIVASSVLEYLAEPEVVLGRLAAMLERDGRLAFSLPNRSSLYRALESGLFRCFGRPRYRRYVQSLPSGRTVRGWLSRVGLEIDEAHWLGPTPLLSALLRPLGLARYSDNLVLYVCREQERSPRRIA